MKRQLFLAIRSIMFGWAALLLTVYLIERPLLNLIARNIDASWFPTIRLMLDCLVLAGIGWLVGHFGRTHPAIAAGAFAATLAFGDFGELVEIRVPWLFQLAGNAVHDPRYWDSLVYTAVVQAFLFGSLIAGALLSRRPRAISSLSIR
jgi:hypothetical protein